MKQMMEPFMMEMLEQKVSYSGLNVKIGAKLGRKFFFRTEVGYSFGDIPKEIFVEGDLSRRTD